MEKPSNDVFEFLEKLNKDNRDSDRFYGFKEHWRDLSQLTGRYCYELLKTIQAISEEEKSFTTSYEKIEQNYPGLTGGIASNLKIPSNQIIESLKTFLGEYEPPDEPFSLANDLIKLHYVIEYFKFNMFKYLPYMVQLKLDVAACKLIGQTAGILSSGIQYGLKKEADFSRTGAGHKSRRQKKENKVRPTVIAELEKYLSENSEDTLQSLFENGVLNILEKRLQEEDVLGKTGGGSVSNIRPIVREYFQEKGTPPPWKRKETRKM